MTAAGRKNTIFGNTCSESLNQLFALVLCQQRIQPVVVKSDVEIMADMAFDKVNMTSEDMQRNVDTIIEAAREYLHNHKE